MSKDVKSFGNFQETNVSGILAAKVLKKSKLALPRSTGIKKKTLPTEHGDHIFKICNTPSARMQNLTDALCKN